MARGGYRAGAGRPKKDKSEAAAEPTTESRGPHDTPLGYMLDVMNDQAVSVTRRDRMAIAAAPFMHPRVERTVLGKKVAVAEAADDAAVGMYETPEPPRSLQ
jgi:hypothetical protein